MPTWPTLPNLLELARWFASREYPKSRRERVTSWGLIVWSDRGELRARRALDEYPDAIFLDDREYRRYRTVDDLLFWGALHNADGRLVGFDVHIVGDPPILDSPLASSTRGAWIEPDRSRPFSLNLLLHEVEEWRVEGTEGFPAEFFADERGDFLLWFGGMEFWLDSPESAAFAMLD